MSQSTEEPLDFETALEELEGIVARLETGQLKLEQALTAYERGIGLLGGCHKMLENVQRRVELLSGVDANGQPIVKPLDPQ